MATQNRSRNSRARLKKIQLSFYVEPEDYKTLRDMSRRTGIPQQVYMRRGLAIILQEDRAADSRSAQYLRRVSAYQRDLQEFILRSEQAIERSAQMIERAKRAAAGAERAERGVRIRAHSRKGQRGVRRGNTGH